MGCYPNKQKQTSGGNAGSLFQAFVGTNALLAKERTWTGKPRPSFPEQKASQQKKFGLCVVIPADKFVLLKFGQYNRRRLKNWRR